MEVMKFVFIKSHPISSAIEHIDDGFSNRQSENALANSKSGSKTVLCDHAGDCQKTHPAC